MGEREHPSTGNPWTILSSTRVYENGHIALVDHEVRNAAGAPSRYGVVHFKESGVRVLPVDAEGSVVLVGQYRLGVGAYTWELPAGGRPSSERPDRAAARELQEEVGVAARTWLPLLHLISCGSVTDETPMAYLAWDLEPRERTLDESEVIALRHEPFAEVVRMALSGEIRDTSSIAAILAAHVKAQLGELPEAVARHLR